MLDRIHEDNSSPAEEEECSAEEEEECSAEDLMAADEETAPGCPYFGSLPGLSDFLDQEEPTHGLTIAAPVTLTFFDEEKEKSPSKSTCDVHCDEVQSSPGASNGNGSATGNGHEPMRLPQTQQTVSEPEEVTPGAYLVEHGIARTAEEANNNNQDSFAWEDNHDQPNVLAVANSVEEVDLSTLQQARPSIESNATGRQKDTPLVALCVFFGLAFIGGIVLLIVFLEPNTNQSKPTNHPAAFPSMAPTSLDSSILSLLADHTVKAVEDKDSPQYEAFEWLLDDPRVYDYPDRRIIQRHALMTLFYATAGPTKWTNNTGWGSYSLHECDWYQNQEFALKTPLQQIYPGFLSGFLEPPPHSNCDDQGFYQHLWLDQNNLVGPLVEELYGLTSIQTLSAGFNRLHGTLSSHIGQLSDLQGLAIFFTELSGSLPQEVGNLSSLQITVFYDNQLEGSIPNGIWQLTNLDTLMLARNTNLQGTIPSIVGALPKLRHLVVDGVDFSGTLPTELGQATSLEWLVSAENRITGTLPSELASLSRLWMLVAYGLQGAVPTELGLLSSLYVLHLRWGSNTGTVPSEIGLLTLLQSLEFDSNRLSGTIPSELSNLSNLDMLCLGGNQLTGGIPSELGLMKSLGRLELQHNFLSGTIPEELVSLQSLYSFRVEGIPLLSGAIPEPLCTINSTCDFEWFGRCEGRHGLSYDCTDMFCGCDCPC